jgi:inosose dehydratase
MKNILSCRPGSYRKYTDIAFEHLAEIGVKYVEYGMPKLEDVPKALEELGKYGLSASSVSGSCDVSNDNIDEEFETQAKVAAEMGAMMIFVSVKAGDLDKQIVYQRLREAGDVAAKYDVIVGMETHPDLITNGDVALETMKGVDHPNIRVNFDTANIYYYNDHVNKSEDGIQEMKKFLDYIGGVHLKDTNGKSKTWYFPTIGEGIVDFAEVFRLLNERDFYGPFTIENEGIRGEDLTLEQTKERMRNSVQYLRDLGCVD